jgi:REP element-mobilizing transposase RayT
MVLAPHVILSCYGFWLPNDPRGSWSDFVRSWELFRFGPATKTTERRSLAQEAHNHQERLAAKQALIRPPVQLTGVQAHCVGAAFRELSAKNGYIIHACAILPEHVHLVVGRHRYNVEQVVGLLKGTAGRRLASEGMHPFGVATDKSPPSIWGRRCWKVFLDSSSDIQHAVEYVENNPLKEDKPRQYWSFVVPYGN